MHRMILDDYRDDDALSAPRGIINAMVISVGFWIAVCLIKWGLA